MKENNNSQQVQELQSQTAQFGLIVFALLSLITLSTVFFHFTEGWDWLDSYYFTIVTVATVGYGDFTPKTDAGKIGATLVIIIGIGLFSAFASMLLKRRALKNIERKAIKAEKKII
jgi:voltage-gated potassium channel